MQTLIKKIKLCSDLKGDGEYPDEGNDKKMRNLDCGIELKNGTEEESLCYLKDNLGKSVKLE